MEFDREEELLIDESQITEEQAPPVIWQHFIKQGIICVILLLTVLWLNQVTPHGTIGSMMMKFKFALKTDANSSFGFIRRQPFINQIVTWSKGIWNQVDDQPVTSDEFNLIPPVPGVIHNYFGWISNSSGKEPQFHPGIDLEAPEGSPVRAGGRGTVQEIRRDSDGSWRVTLNHGGNNRSIYGNCSQVVVQVGEEVEVGQEIGKVGRGGVEGQTVHWEVWKGIQPIDPKVFVETR